MRDAVVPVPMQGEGHARVWSGDGARLSNTRASAAIPQRLPGLMGMGAMGHVNLQGRITTINVGGEGRVKASSETNVGNLRCRQPIPAAWPVCGAASLLQI